MTEQLVAATPKRRLAVFLDGTWNTSLSNTNVWRMKSLCSQSDQQLVYYSKGVGTNFGERFLGGTLGIGLDKEITDAYEWLIENYKPGDELYIFGFSRGAYTARSLAGFISHFGLLKLGAPIGIGQLFDRYKTNPEARSIRHLQNPDHPVPVSQEDRWLAKYSMAIRIKFVGVWDTVGSLGIPSDKAPFFSSKNYGFHKTDLMVYQQNAFHAIALDEHRKSFSPTLWTATRKKINEQVKIRKLEQVEQRWFVGAHANIGGGYSSDALAQLPLNWLLQKAKALGLNFIEEFQVDPEAADDDITDSYENFLWSIVRFFIPRFYRKIGSEPLDNGETVTSVINETIDASVFQRWQKDPKYRPKSLMEWAARKNVDPSQISTTVSASSPPVAAASLDGAST
ncbi:MAG: DUF2235 domain-containing protein [Proteobacteria bacterium]|nr:MAG: DUF2235 domain-containing protein [Pseudomonadota bacterium]